MTDGSSGVAPYGAQSTRNRETNLDRRTMAYLRRRRKRRKAADAAGFSMLDLGTPVYGWEPGNVAGTIGGGWASGAGTVSRIYDQVVGTARDLVQLSGGAQPAIQEDGGERWARFASGNSMVASGLTLPTICTIQIMVRIAAAGVNADTDAIFVLDNGAGKSLTLQAGDAAEFLADLVGVGTGIASVADFAAADLADDTAHLISIEINQTTDVVSVLIDNQIRAIATGFTGTLDGSWSLTLGGSLDFDFGWAYICSDEYSAAEYASAGAFAESYGATMVSGELTTRFSVAPALTASGGYLVGQDVETDDGTTVNLRDEADSFTYAWRAQAGGLIGGETGDTLTLTIGEEGDEVRSEVANTVLGVAVSGNSAYGDTVSSNIEDSAILRDGPDFDPSASSFTITGLAIGDAYTSRRIGVGAMNETHFGTTLTSITVHVPDIATDPTGTALTIHGSTANSASLSGCQMASGIIPTGTVCDIVATYSSSPIFGSNFFVFSIDDNALADGDNPVFVSNEVNGTSPLAIGPLNCSEGSIICGCASVRQGAAKSLASFADEAMTDLIGYFHNQQALSFYNFDVGTDASFDLGVTWTGTYDVSVCACHWEPA